MSIYPLAGKKIIVFGLARSGLAAITWLQQQGAYPIGVDADPQKCHEARALGAQIGEFETIKWQEIAAVLQSPGIPLHHPLTKRAYQHYIPVLSDCELFRHAYPRSTYIGVTGTNGKSTTTALIGHILQQAGYLVAIGGNIGVPVLSLPDLGVEGIYVFELSSYQLEMTASLNVDIVAWLNISEDHLDRHGSMDDYIKAKGRIFSCATYPPKSIVGVNDVYSQEIYRRQSSLAPERAIAVSMGQRPDNGLWVYNHKLYHIDGDQEKQVIDFNGSGCLIGLHNEQNMAVAYGICHHLGLPSDKILAGIQTFPGLEHRQEVVATFDDMTFINDSKATNADAAAKALSLYDNVYWIAGGVAKRDGIGGLHPYFPHIKHAFLFGQAQTDFATTLTGKVDYTCCNTLDQAVSKAYQAAHNDPEGKRVVLFSPACASFDQFQDFEHRGRIFKQLVHRLRDFPC